MNTISITNYDGSIVTTPLIYVHPENVEEIQAILREPDRFPSPVRAMGSFHSLTPCAATPGTVVSMTRFKTVATIDRQAMTFTAGAGLQIREAAEVLRAENLQLMLNIEIGNMTLGSAACCHSKDALDCVEFGQVNSYLVAVKWVSPSGALEEASEVDNPELMSFIRASYGLAGIIYEVTFRIKPLEIVRFNYEIHDADALTEELVDEVIASNQCMVCWTIERRVVIQTRNHATALHHDWAAESRRFAWNFLGAFSSRAIRQLTPGGGLTRVIEDIGGEIELGFYKILSAAGGFTLYNPDKIVDYSHTPQAARYAFTFWAFPRKDWVRNLKAYLEFSDAHFRERGFRCNMPLGSYFIRRDTHSLLSYTCDGDVISLDPIHAPGDRDKTGWENFLRAFNEWAYSRGGSPLLNQSPFVKKEHVVSAYGDRWQTLVEWIRRVDPDGRMMNPFFHELIA
jgi:FAD/FMN-containing dehydrogenase